MTNIRGESSQKFKRQTKTEELLLIILCFPENKNLSSHTKTKSKLTKFDRRAITDEIKDQK